MKRTAIKRSRKPIVRRKRPAPVSARKREQRAERAAFVAEQLRLRPCCEAAERLMPVAPMHHCSGRAVELHEPLTRARSGSRHETLVDPANSIAVCRRCHRFIHTHPALALEIGLLRSSS